jgi:hypothetical protein
MYTLHAERSSATGDNGLMGKAVHARSRIDEAVVAAPV